jgi:hypothetical protein
MKVEFAASEMARRKYERQIHKQDHEKRLHELTLLFKDDYQLKPGRQRPRNPDEKRTLERWRRNGDRRGTI